MNEAANHDIVGLNNVTFNGIEGTREEISDLKSLIEEVTERCYAGSQDSLIENLATLLQEQACQCEGNMVCRELIEAVETWANTKLAQQTAVDFLMILDDSESAEDLTGADDWANGTSCDKSPVEQLQSAHCTKEDEDSEEAA